MENNNQNIIAVSGIGTLKLLEPVDIDGEAKTEIPYDFEKISGQDLDKIMKLLSEKGHMISFEEFDKEFHLEIFAYAANIDYLDILRFCGIDFLKAGRLARDFFFFGSGASQQQNSLEG